MDKIFNFVDYFNIVKRINDNCSDSEMIFYRGVSDSDFDLKPGILFENNINEYDSYHELLLEYPEEFDTKDHLGTLAKMQHYGVNTRLLDISDNILTSLFFASEQRPEKDGKIWVFKVHKNEVLHSNSDKALMLSCLSALREDDKREIREFCDAHRGVISDQQIVGHPAMVKFLHEIRGEYPAFETSILGQDILDCFFVLVNKNNIRMKVQSGFFVIFGLDNDANKKKLENLVVDEIIVDKDSKKRILKELKLMRIHSDTIYPDLERTAIYLRNKKLGWKNLED